MLANPEGGDVERAALPLWLRMVLLCLGYFACAWLGRFISPANGTAISYWLPGGLYVAVLLVNPSRDWPWLMLSILLANIGFDVIHDEHPNFIVIGSFCAANVIQGGVGAWLVRRYVARYPTLASLKEFFGLMFFSGVIGSAIGATIGAVMLNEMHLLTGTVFQTWQILWGGDVMAVLVLAPLVLVFGDAATRNEVAQWKILRLMEGMVLFGGMAALLWYLFVQQSGVNGPKVPAIPFLIWAALRFGLPGASMMTFLVAILGSYLTTRYLKGLSAEEIASGSYVFTLQSFVAAAATIGLVPTIVLNERDRTMARLRESESRFRSLTEAAFEAVIISENGRVQDISDQGLKMFGYERREVIGKHVLDLCAPASRLAVAEALRLGQDSIYGHELLRRDGTTFYAEAQSRYVNMGGRTLRMTALRDITARLKAEQALRESEEKFSKAFQASPDGLAVSELATGRYIVVNDGSCRLFGFTREEMVGRTSFELGIWQDSGDRAKLAEALKKDGELRNLEVRMRNRSGQVRIMLLSAERITLADKECVVSAVHDVTEQMAAQQALRESEEKFSKAFRASPDVMSIVDFESSRYIEVNEAHEQVFGFRRDEVVGHTPAELGIFDDPNIRANIWRELKEKGFIHNLEIEAQTRDGRKLVLQHSAELIELGGRQCLLRVSRDITEERRARQALRESEEKFSKAFQTSPDVIAIIDLEAGCYIDVNSAHEQTYGFRRDEAIGHSPAELGIQRNPEVPHRIFSDLMAGKLVRDSEIETHTRDGRKLRMLYNAELIEIAGRKCVLNVSHDITERKRAEELNRMQLQVLKMIVDGEPMGKTLDVMLRVVESLLPGALVSILLLDEDGVHVRHGAAPSLPAEFIQAVDGEPIGPCAGSCGTAAYRREPVFVADIATDPLWANYRALALAHGLLACWSTPFFDAQQRVLGTFAIYHRYCGMPDEDQLQLIGAVTQTAAICVLNHRTEDEKRQSIEREQAARIEYTLRLIASQEAERKRIAAEIHDSLGQNLLLVKNLAQTALREQNAANAYEQLASINSLTAQCIAEARQMSRELHPYQIEHLGLKRALESLLENTAKTNTVQFTWKFDDLDEGFPAESATNIYRIVQESLNNILKHAQARKVDVRLERDIHELQLFIADDGRGFTPGRGTPGMGLKNITERVRMLGGKLKLESAAGQGTRIEVRIPVKDEAA